MGERGTGPAASVVEVRVLDGPNLYFTRPAIKLTMAVPGWLALPEARVARAAERLGVPGAGPRDPRVRPGAPGSEQRRRFVSRVAAHLARALAEASRTRLGVRARPGPGPEDVVVAFPWRHRGAAEALAEKIPELMDELITGRRSPSRLIEEAARDVAGAEPGPAPSVPDPVIPVIAVTGTNGKTTSVRLLAHIGRTAGLTVAYSSTDGVYLNGELVEEGDYSGFGGAARALAQPAVELAVLETARGGILLRGMGTQHNDVALVTNISADHLGLHGIRTLDQLAEVKACVTRITRPDGWDVLNADDPRVLAMRRVARGRPWLFSMDPDHPAIRSVLEEGGRAASIEDGHIVLFTPGRDPDPLVALEDVPLTLSGISRQNVQNALGAACAALGAGLPRASVVEGLRTFVPDPRTNPARANVFEVDGRIVVVDYAHNPAGLAGLVEISRGLRPPGGDVWLTFSTAGDRTDEILHELGYIAARGADHAAVGEMVEYLRGRDRRELVERLVAGALDGGASEVPIHPDLFTGFHVSLEASKRGDVVAVTALIERERVFELLERRGAKSAGPARIRRLVRRARAASAR